MRSLLAASFLAFCTFTFSQSDETHGLVSQRIADLRSMGTSFTPVSLFEQEDAGSATDRLWGRALTQAVVLRFDPWAAQALMDARDEFIALSIPTASDTLVLDLQMTRVVADDFVVRSASGGRPQEVPSAVHYRGMIRDVSTSLVAISVFEHELMGIISDADGERVIGPFADARPGLHVLYREADLPRTTSAACGTPDLPVDDAHGYDAEPGGDRSTRCVRWYWELAYDIYQDKGSVTNAANFATGLFNQSATLFANDGVDVMLQEVFVWNTPSPYNDTTSAARLSRFGTTRTSFNGDMAHLLDYGPYGGIAWVNTLCSSNTSSRMAYSGIYDDYDNVPTYSWSVNVVTHEQGHNLGSSHTHACVWNGNGTAIDGCGPTADPDHAQGTCATGPLPSQSVGGTIMSYCHLLFAVGVHFVNGFGPQPAAVILNNVNAAACLPSCGANCGTPPAPNTATSDHSATVTWTGVSGANGYVLRWKPSSSVAWTTIYGINTTSYLICGLAAGTSYDVAIRTICPANLSSFGATTSFTTGPEVSIHTQLNKAVASDRAAGERFGSSADIDGDYAVIGAYMDVQGSAYIFKRVGGNWIQQQKLLPGDLGGGTDFFGFSVAISGDWILVGSPNEDQDATGGGTTVNNAGAAYFFLRNGDTWSQVQKVVAGDRGSGDNFGRQVDLDGAYAVLGSWHDDEDAAGANQLSNAGSAYVFSRSGNTWSQQQKLSASDRYIDDAFGREVAIAGDQIIIGAPYEDQDSNGGNTYDGSGSAYFFLRNGNTWTQQQKITAAVRGTMDSFGGGLDISGDQAIIGAWYEGQDELEQNGISGTGSAYIFTRVGSGWQQVQKIVASDRSANDNFGIDVAISGDRAIVGAYHEDHDANGANAATDAGSAYIFQRCGNTWAQRQKVVASDRAASDFFGEAVAIDGINALAGASYEDEDAAGGSTAANAGSVYFFSTPSQSSIAVSPRIHLEGPFNSGTGLMSDGLRSLGLVPLAEPYTALGYAHLFGGGETTTSGVLAITGNNAIVDWVVVELRNSSTPSTRVATRSALLQRDGDVVGTDGTSSVQFNVAAGNYYVAIRHRNHLGVMTANAMALSTSPTVVDLTSAATTTYGTNARKTIGTAQVLWAGNPFRDNSVRYTGSNNDRDPILVRVGSTTPNNSVNGYWLEDVNMDGTVKYTGATNDRDPILVNVGSTTPNSTRSEQLP